MRLRRSIEGPAPTTVVTDPVLWDGVPFRPAREPLIRAPRAGELVAQAAPAPATAPRAA